jgi:hypothetical protein
LLSFLAILNINSCGCYNFLLSVINRHLTVILLQPSYNCIVYHLWRLYYHFCTWNCYIYALLFLFQASTQITLICLNFSDVDFVDFGDQWRRLCWLSWHNFSLPIPLAHRGRLPWIGLASFPKRGDFLSRWQW